MADNKKAIREAFRSGVFERDGHRCRACGATGGLNSHHITDRREMPNGGYVKENGVSLCEPCHLKAEKWHSSGKTTWDDGYHPDDLYRLIGSSYEAARRGSLGKRLGQAGELEASEDLRLGRYRDFETMDDFINAL
jgi:hypothetical protein